MSSIAFALLRTIVKLASPEIRKSLVDMVLDWEKKAMATPNKADDALVYIVKILLDINEE